MQTLRVILGDLRHETVGIHSTYIPVGIGYMATYIESRFPNQEFDFQLFTRPGEIFECIDSWSPHVLALSNYMWNAALSYRVCEYAKSVNGNVLTVLGGPEFPSGTGQSNFETTETLCTDYLIERPAIDYYCYSDGETALTSLVKCFADSEYDVNAIRNLNEPIDGTVSVNLLTKKLIKGKPQKRIGLNAGIGRDEIPSPYLSGLLDKFLNGSYIPSIESRRGCPFQCTFCDQGLDSTKLASFSTERIIDELDYISEKIAWRKEANTLAFFDSNWGMYRGDVDVAKHIATIIEKWDWPKAIDLSTPKNRKDRVLEIDSILNNRLDLALSQQSMNRDTLEEIKRANYTNQEYLEFVKELEERGHDKALTCELIIPLPGETEESYYESVKILIENGLRIGTYTLMMLMGAELGRSGARKKYSMVSRYRIVPRQFGEYRGKKCFDIEEVCVQTNTMSFDAYLRCRRFSFVVEVLSSKFFDPMRRHLIESGISYYEVVRAIHSGLESKNNVSELHKVYENFSNESVDELYDSKLSIQEYFADTDNYDRLLQSELGDNLLRKYSTIMLYRHLEELVDYCYTIIFSNFISENNHNHFATGDSVRTWIIESNFLSEFNQKNRDKYQKSRVLKLVHDVPKWLEREGRSLAEFNGEVSYLLTSQREELENELVALYGESNEYQIGKIFHSRSGSEFFCKYEQV